LRVFVDWIGISIVLVANRIKSVKNIEKITKSMKMVAASKLRRATASMLQAREYVGGVRTFFDEVKHVVA
jgi:F0F1-type ATP synthase gamma subunit